MADAPYTLIANASGVFEQKIGTCGSEAEHWRATAQQSPHVVSNTVVDGRAHGRRHAPVQGRLAAPLHIRRPAEAPATMNFMTAYRLVARLRRTTRRTATRPLTLSECPLARHGLCDAAHVPIICHTNGTPVQTRSTADATSPLKLLAGGTGCNSVVKNRVAPRRPTRRAEWLAQRNHDVPLLAVYAPGMRWLRRGTSGGRARPGGGDRDAANGADGRTATLRHHQGLAGDPAPLPRRCGRSSSYTT